MYGIELVEDDVLPEGCDFMLIQAGEDFGIFYRASAVNARVLEDSWAAYRLLGEVPPRSPLRLVVAATG